MQDCATSSISQTSAPDVLVEVRDVVKIFRDFWGRPKARALSGISFHVKRGEVFGLLGPNGSGKSTTMKLLLGLLFPSSGELRILGQTPRNVHVKSLIGYMPEESYLYPYLSAEETLVLYGRLLNLETEERNDRMAQLLDMIGLTHARNRAVGEFSKGMARRISLAQALLNDPDLIFLDEPTAGLDPIGCHQFKQLILKLAERGKTVILCSHLLADVEDVCDRIAILYNGRICAQGEVQNMLRKTGHTRLTLSQPSPDALREIKAWIWSKWGYEPTIDHPARTLEDLFLDAIRSAQADHNAFSGADHGGELAPFLKGTTPSRTP